VDSFQRVDSNLSILTFDIDILYMSNHHLDHHHNHSNRNQRYSIRHPLQEVEDNRIRSIRNRRMDRIPL